MPDQQPTTSVETGPDRAEPRYPLVWPRELFGTELQAVLQLDGDDRTCGDALSLLFDEALWGPQPREDLAGVPRYYTVRDSATGKARTRNVRRPWASFGHHLLAHLEQLPEHRPRRYLSRMPEPTDLVAGLRPADLQNEWIRVVIDLEERGYLDRRAGYDHDVDGVDRARLHRLVREHCGLDIVWPLDPLKAADEKEEFLTLVEVFHDLVSRPRGGHRGSPVAWPRFDDVAGQAVYRWRVNGLLDRHETGLRLAEDGEDLGHLVHAVVDPRRDLLVEARRTAPEDDRARVDHAIATFRRRGATLEEKRSACEALATLLEDRDRLAQRKLNSKDERHLSEIANGFGIRHRNGKQRTDYGEEYLDWIFWWYLATVELTNRLLIRPPDGDGQG